MQVGHAPESCPPALCCKGISKSWIGRYFPCGGGALRKRRSTTVFWWICSVTACARRHKGRTDQGFHSACTTHRPWRALAVEDTGAGPRWAGLLPLSISGRPRGLRFWRPRARPPHATTPDQSLAPRPPLPWLPPQAHSEAEVHCAHAREMCAREPGPWPDRRASLCTRNLENSVQDNQGSRRNVQCSRFFPSTLARLSRYDACRFNHLGRLGTL